MTKRKKSRWFALGLAVLAILMLLVNLCFYGACDELYFTAWEFSSLRDLILSRPELKGSYVVGVMHNGRIMGNLIGVAQAMLLFSSVGWLRGVLFTGILLILAYLIMPYDIHLSFFIYHLGVPRRLGTFRAVFGTR